MHPTRTAVALCALALLWAPGARAAIIPLQASLDCAQAGTCGAGGSGTGTASITLDDQTNLLSWNLSYSGLSAPVTAAHFHGPAPPGEPAGIQVGIGTDNPAVGSATISAEQAGDLLAGLWYVNVHSSAFSGGEIRGQVVPEPGTLGLVGLGVTLLAARRRRA